MDIKEITSKLETGLKEIFESENYLKYLNTMAKFHKYSLNNTLLISMQKPDATFVAGYQAWKSKFQRHVKKGEKGIQIIAPAPFKLIKQVETDDNEEDTVEVTVPAYRTVTVFDLAQTEGKPLPVSVFETHELTDRVKDFGEFMEVLTSITPVPIEYKDILGSAKGYFSNAEGKIVIQESMSESQTVKTAIHEITHAILHDTKGNKVILKDRSTKEVEAESVAYVVCQHFGIDTSDYSFVYIASWSSGKDVKELKASMDIICKTASQLISSIEEGLLLKIKNV